LNRNKWIIISAVVGFISLSTFIFYYNNNQNLYRSAFSGTDKFGIREIYPTKLGGEEWSMNMQDPSDDPDGSYKITKQEVRMEVYPSAGYNQDQITTSNQRELTTKGYMQSPNDWKNVEMTGYVKLTQ
jgi:hypothetical protein